MDGLLVKNAALALQGQAGNTAAAQRQIVEGLLCSLTGYYGNALETVIGVLAEGTGKFTAAERKANPSAYQYASRLKSIVGACLFAVDDVLIEDKTIPAYTLTGDVNTMYSEAVKALRVRDLDWKGERVSVAKAKKAAEEREVALAVEQRKLSHNKPEASLAELESAIQQNVAAAEAAAMLENLQKRAEKAAAKLIESLGPADAMVYAQAFIQTIASRQ